MGSVISEFRRTGLTAKVIDDHLNDWEDFAGEDINVDVAYKYAVGAGADEWTQDHWGYRGQAAMCKTTDGTKIVRVRVGDGSTADKQVWKQEITDPTDISQWTTWTLLYSGDHYAIGIEPTTGSSYRVIHSKSNGIYVNNVLKISALNVVRIKPIALYSGAVLYQQVTQDTDGARSLEWYYTSDVVTPVASGEDSSNYRWYRHDIGAILHDSTFVFSVHSMAMDGGARDQTSSQQLLSTFWNTTYPNNWGNVDVISGPSGQAGYKTFSDITLVAGVAGGYYLFYTMTHRDSVGNDLANLRKPLMWSRTMGIPQDWSEPVPVGYTVWGFSGVVEFGAYVYIAGNGRVLRRLSAATEIDITDYVVEGDYELPRESQKGTGTLHCANPDNETGALLGLTSTTDTGLTERRLELQLGTAPPGQIVASGDAIYGVATYGGAIYGAETADPYTWKIDSPWWVSSLGKTRANDQQRVDLQFSDFWHRLENPFRDTISLRGNLVWHDWQAGGQNQLFNYTNDGFEFYRVADSTIDAYRMRTTDGITLFTGWRGENGSLSVVFSSSTGKLVFRYEDANNHYFVEYDGTFIKLVQVSGGEATEIGSVLQAASSGFTLGVDFRWKRIDVYYNGSLKLLGSLVDAPVLLGFVGVGKSNDPSFEIRNFDFSEYNRQLTTRTLIGKLLNYVEEFGVIVDSSLTDADQINVIWGPQSDLDTPEKGLRQLLEADKLDVAYLPSDGYYHVGRFGDEQPAYTIENEIFNQDQVNEGKLRPNVVSVDGNDDSWTQYDRAGLNTRDRTVNRYLDLPELRTPGEVRNRAQQEIIDSTRFNSPGGDVIWRPEFSRMDTVYWVDEVGNVFRTRIEGLKVDFNQSTDPFQHATIDAGTFVYCPPDEVPASYIARDVFKRTSASGWGSAQTGGTWTSS